MNREITVMIGFCSDSAEVFARGIRRAMGCLVLLVSLVFLTGCPEEAFRPVPKEGKTSTPGKPSEPGRPSEPRKPNEPKISVGEPPVSIALDENGPEALVTLPYESQGGAVPTSCEVSSPLMVTVTKPCDCSKGVCRVGVQPTPEVFGDGSFEFRLSDQSGQKEISSNTGKASVRVLEVTLSISSGDTQEGTVGTKLPNPIVASVRNSDGVPVRGVKVFWDIEKRSYASPFGRAREKEKEEWFGKLSCAEKTDERGLAQCAWTLGTRIPAGANSQRVNVSAFYERKDIYKKALGGSFSASVKPDSAVMLSFRPQDYSADGPDIYFGPTTPDWYVSGGYPPYDGKPEKAGVPLGRNLPLGMSSGSEKKSDACELLVFVQDQYGNATTVKGGVTVTLSLGEKKPEGAVLLGTAGKVMIETLKYGPSKRMTEWTQSLARFKDIKLNKAGKYSLTAMVNGADLRVANDFGDLFTVEPGAAAKLAFDKQPGGGIAGTVWSQQPVVVVQDAFGNVADSSAYINLAISTNPNPGTGVLSGVSSLKVVGGVGTFSDLFINKAGKGYVLTASGEGFLPVVSKAFNIDENTQSGNPSVFLTLNENGPETMVTLPRGQGNAVPTSCEAGSPLMVTVTTPCACSMEVCRVGIQPKPRSVGEGSFEFRLLGQNGVSLSTGKVLARVLEVTMSISSGDNQGGIAGENLPAPVVVLIQNSDGHPVRGAKIFGKYERRRISSLFREARKEEWFGKISCAESDDQGLARCTWTIGTKIPSGAVSQTLRVSAFFDENYKKTLVGSFSASVKAGPAATLSFFSQDYYEEEVSDYIYSGPLGSPIFEWVDEPLRKGRMVIYARDQYGNATTVKEGVTMTLSLGEIKPGGAVLSGTLTQTMSNEPLTLHLHTSAGEEREQKWTQGLARFKDVKVNKKGIYTFSVTASDPSLKPSAGGILSFEVYDKE